MNKQELVNDVQARSNGLSKHEVGTVVDAVFASITEALGRGGEVNIIGFGKFKVSPRAARMGVNPRTGEKMEIPASKLPKFTPGTPLKQAVNV